MVKTIHKCGHYFQERNYCTRANKGEKGKKLSCMRPMPVVNDNKSSDCHPFCRKVNSKNGWGCHICNNSNKKIYNCKECKHKICNFCSII